jgi:hypothetical protein
MFGHDGGDEPAGIEGERHMSWYYCLVHQRVEPEEGCANAERLGPYATEAEAQSALERARERNEAFDADED